MNWDLIFEAELEKRQKKSHLPVLLSHTQASSGSRVGSSSQNFSNRRTALFVSANDLIRHSSSITQQKKIPNSGVFTVPREWESSLRNCPWAGVGKPRRMKEVL